MSGSLSGARNICSVRQRPMPLAPSATPRWTCSAVSALTRISTLPSQTSSAREQGEEFGRGRQGLGGECACIDLARGTVNRDLITDRQRCVSDLYDVAMDVHGSGTNYRRDPALACDDRRMARSVTSRDNDSARYLHANDVIRSRHGSHEDWSTAFGHHSQGAFGAYGDYSTSGSRRCPDPLRKRSARNFTTQLGAKVGSKVTRLDTVQRSCEPRSISSSARMANRRGYFLANRCHGLQLWHRRVSGPAHVA